MQQCLGASQWCLRPLDHSRCPSRRSKGGQVGFWILPSRWTRKTRNYVERNWYHSCCRLGEELEDSLSSQRTYWVSGGGHICPTATICMTFQNQEWLAGRIADRLSMWIWISILDVTWIFRLPDRNTYLRSGYQMKNEENFWKMSGDKATAKTVYPNRNWNHRIVDVFDHW